MAEQKNVSPLLDGFMIGTPVSNHFGVSCYPAVKANSSRKYIVKIISIPASQAQLDALLITGAYKDLADAAEYYRGVAERTVQEAEFLKTISRLEGFIPYEDYQVEPMTKNHLGYELYLVSGFRLSLERYMHRHTVSHQEAVNLGIDLCAALAACRRAGMIYIDLKPANVFISTKKEYKIGDLGFASLDSLKYSSMPEKYRSVYTAPELQDDLNVLNTTADTYSAGMILYQLYNDGILPEDRTIPLPPPVKADEAMAKIILKACAPDPDDRWEDPIQMGQALTAYLQNNEVSDTLLMAPITGCVLGTGPEYATTKFPSPEQATEEVPVEAVPAETAETADDVAQPAEPEASAEAYEVPEEESDSATVAEADEVIEETAEAGANAENEDQAEPFPEDAAELPDTAEEAEPEAEDVDVTEETAEVPAEQSEELPPEPVEPEPDPIELQQDMEAAAVGEFTELADSIPSEPEIPDGEHLDHELKELNKIIKKEKPKKKKKKENIKPVIVHEPRKKPSIVKILSIVLLVSILVVGGFWGYLYYQLEYLQTIRSISIQGAQDSMTVFIDSDIDENLLTAVCTDTFGHAVRQRFRDGKTTFTQLSPASLYKVQLEVSGLHKLVGQLSDIYTTDSVTNVAGFTAAVGPEDGSVTLNLVVDGHEPNQWQVIYTAAGEPELGHTFSGHTATITNLVLGKEYTFRIETGTHEAVNGQNSLVFTPQKVVTAKNLQVVSCTGSTMVVRWEEPEGAQTESWRVRCYGEDYDQVSDCVETQATFTGVDSKQSYTIEVTAKGMTQSAKVAVSANAVSLTDFTVSEVSAQTMNVGWTFNGNAPENGWRLSYTLDNGDLPTPAICNGATAVIEPIIPGAVYHFTVQTSDGVTVFNGSHTFTASSSNVYKAHGFEAVSLNCRTLATPVDEKWSVWTVGNNFSNSFPVGQPISIVLSANQYFQQDDGNVHVLYVFRDASGNVLPELVAEEDLSWHAMWNDRSDYQNAELELPIAPFNAGTYTLNVCFDGCTVAQAEFTVY